MLDRDDDVETPEPACRECDDAGCPECVGELVADVDDMDPGPERNK